MSKGGQGTTQQARGSFSGNSQPSYGGNQATGLGSKGGSQPYQQPYQQPYRSPYGQGQSYSRHGMRSGFGDFMENPQAIPTTGQGQFGNASNDPRDFEFQSPPQPPNIHLRTRGPESLVEQGGMAYTQGPVSIKEQQQQESSNDPLGFQGSSPNSYNNNFGPYVGNAGGFGSKGGQARQMGYAPMRQGLGGFF